jgi:hypothetical protein
MLFFPPAPTGWIIDTPCETSGGVAKHSRRDGKWPSTVARRTVGVVACRTKKYDDLYDAMCGVDSRSDVASRINDAGEVGANPARVTETFSRKETAMTFIKPDDEEIKCSSWDALRWHIEACHKEIDFLRDVCASQAAMIGKFNKGEPIKITDGDIETWHNLPVLVPVGLIPEGRTPCEVRGFSLDGDLRILLADRPAPQFELGKHYKNRRGEIHGPLKQTPAHHSYAKTHPLFCRGWTWTLDGICQSDGKTIDDDSLAPGAVDPPPTWIPWPWLPDGEYKTAGMLLCGSGVSMNLGYAKQLRGYTSDPAPGRWKVTNGTATWLGE